jgi:hypothetical protein
MNKKLSSINLNIFFNFRTNIFEKIYIYSIISFIFFSYFISIPSDTTGIGISSSILGIGDRIFYINETIKGYGYEDYSGNILYPLVLKLVTYFVGIFGEDQYSRIWNLIVILISSSFSIISLRLLRLSSYYIFNEKISRIACIIYICNPYTFYYSLSGGITNYLIIGISFILYLFCKCFYKGYRLTKENYIYDIFLVTLGCSYLSFLRPNAGLFSIIILIILLWKNIKNTFFINEINSLSVLKLIIIIFGIGVTFYNLELTYGYSLANVSLFAREGGSFFGFSRDELRSRLTIIDGDILNNAKVLFYFALWKITDFVSGMSDIRDSHSGIFSQSMFPFIMRTFTGIFFLFPINFFSFLGIVTNKSFILKSELWIILLASFFAISPSLIGVSMSRYLMMFYPPFILFSAKMIHDTLQGVSKAKLK